MLSTKANLSFWRFFNQGQPFFLEIFNQGQPFFLGIFQPTPFLRWEDFESCHIVLCRDFLPWPTFLGGDQNCHLVIRSLAKAKLSDRSRSYILCRCSHDVSNLSSGPSLSTLHTTVFPLNWNTRSA